MRIPPSGLLGFSLGGLLDTPSADFFGASNFAASNDEGVVETHPIVAAR